MTTQGKILSFVLGIASIAATRAQFAPLSLTPDSYNYDVIVEKGATPPPAPASTATLDDGTNNTANTFYEQGFNLDSPTSGLPAAGSTITSETLTDHNFTLAASYTTNNAILLDSSISNATYTVTTPATLTAISFLAASGGGASTNNVIIHHTNNTTETNQIIVPDWYGGDNVALTLNGRVDAVSRTFSSVDSGNPRLYSVDTPVANTSPVTSLSFEHLGGGRTGIFAVSGANGGAFNNLAGTGFTYDMVIEATAEQQLNGLNATTATLDAGAGNIDNTWYEQGYNTAAPLTGLPAPSKTLTNSSATDHIYSMAPDYTVNDAILVDSANPAVTVTPATPTTASGLSFLGSSGNGAMLINYTLHHADGSTQDGSFTLPDWYNATPVAYIPNGRVNVVNGGFQSVNSDNPRIYGVDVSVNNTASPITSIDLSYTTGNGHAAILAISSTGGAVKPIIDLQPNSVNVQAGGNTELDAIVSGTPPINVQWQVGTNGNFVNLTNSSVFSGVTTTNLVVTGVTITNAADYRLVASNSAGTNTTATARINVVSSKTDVTDPADTVTLVGGTTPGAEGVEHAIDNDTAKYLNFGTDGDQNAPFVGPVGLTVTLANGPAVVTGLRVYTANDATDRDPIDFKLEGSSDGTNFATVASGALSLPLTRNASGQAIDPLTLANEEVNFSNSAGYATYRLTFANVRNNTNANSMQIGEIELLGAAGAGSASLSVSLNANGTMTITSSGPGTLQSTSSLTPPVAWTNEGAINGSTTVPTTGTMKFFRVLQ